MKYYANFLANNGTRLMQPITGCNKNELIRKIRGLAEAERFQGNGCSWEVWCKTRDESWACKTVAAGGVDNTGYRFRII